MKKLSFKFWLGMVVAICGAFPVHADPISLPEPSLTPQITFLVSFSILLEAVCILLLLWNFRKPRFFILWILGLHVITYPVFLTLVWQLNDLRPAVAVAIGEGLVVLLEGTLIYGICRYVPTRQKLPPASLNRCWLVSLAGNACSLVAFPILMNIYDLISRHR